MCSTRSSRISQHYYSAAVLLEVRVSAGRYLLDVLLLDVTLRRLKIKRFVTLCYFVTFFATIGNIIFANYHDKYIAIFLFFVVFFKDQVRGKKNRNMLLLQISE